MAVARRDNEIDTADAAVERQVDVALDTASETRHRRVEAEVGDARNRFSLARSRARTARFDDADAGRIEFSCDFGFVRRRQ
ncbi:hypothetical protein HAL_23340 [Haladaptatus sp. T7]|nr:hypothetical protein HAL_23340 [Haladaptatus sp. T7]